MRIANLRRSSFRRVLAACLLTVLPEASARGAERLAVAPNLYCPGKSASDPAPAERRFQQAIAAAENGQASLAFQGATLTVATDANHAAARRVLGYLQNSAGEWSTPLALKMEAQGKTWHPQFGWIAKADIPRSEAGERKFGNRWITTEADAQQHRTIATGWRVRTDHYSVTTNHSLEAGVKLAEQLEGFYQLWNQLFAGYWLEEREVRDLFAGKRGARQRSAPFRVVMHATKAEYVAALQHRQPRIAETLGIYFDALREAHFYAVEDETQHAAQRATLFHEATHQLFQEIQPTGRNVGKNANFWVVEGVACYLESLRPRESGEYELAAPNAGRLPAAIKRRLVDEYYIPLEELADLGMSDLQRRADLAPLYSQSAGLATYFMHGEGGMLREPFVRYLRSVYRGRPDGGELFRILGKKPSELDAAYRLYLLSLSREAPPGKVE